MISFSNGSRYPACVVWAISAMATATSCGDPGAVDGELTGVALLALTAADGVGSVEVEFAGASRSVTRCVPVDGQPTTRLSGLPTGSVVINASAFEGATCAGEALWLAESQTVRFTPGRPTPVRITFRPNGIAEVGTDFIDDVAATEGWEDNCDGDAFDESYVIWQTAQARVFDYESPPGHLAVADGHCTYTADPMITNRYPGPTRNEPDDLPEGSYNLSTALERSWQGEHWVFDTEVTSHVEAGINACGLQFGIFFGDGSHAAWISTYRTEGAEQYWFSAGDYNEQIVSAPDERTFSIRIERDGGLIVVSRSFDGVEYNELSRSDLGTEIDGLDQTLYVTGLAWYRPGTCFQAFDYFSVTPE